jgi:hypothetical protein
MLTAGIACYRAWRAEGGREPAAVAGHSLGEYSALVAAGALDAGRRAAAGALSRRKPCSRRCRWAPGAMAAMLGLEPAQVAEGCAEAAAESGEVVAAANFNDPKQTVISGSRPEWRKRCEVLKAMGAKRALPLAGVGAVSLSADEAGGRGAARAAGRCGFRSAAHRGGQQHRRGGARPSPRHPRRAVPAGLRPGALGRGRAGTARARPGPLSSSAAPARCWPAWSSASMASCVATLYDPASWPNCGELLS